ncbi:hypothetical protein C1T31_04720 [Hanstruepera neustonica]|uniref:Cadherin domain-containing protein n=2 Tax=Hanstruepera neustonica TaxID=1445657 RepID=A0A2K1E050_9FLAO|nr:hypothetical protein C1T31_04720 [Hanstruepera neustonica]
MINSCSSDDNDNQNLSNNVNTSIDENPRSGDLVATITTNLVGNITYSLISESVTGAFTIGNDSGELRVADWQAFDFETNSSITAIVTATDGINISTYNINVNLNDMDDIWSFLNTSRTDYENAANGDWVIITESEYNDLANYLNETTKSGASDTDMFSSASIAPAGSPFTVANNNGENLPEGSYFIAFKYYSWDNNVVSNRVKLSTSSITGPYENIGGALPEHDSEYNHFVYKGSNNAISSTGYLAFYESVSMGYKNIQGNTNFWYATGDSNMLDSEDNTNAVFLYQGLSTTQKQWD